MKKKISFLEGDSKSDKNAQKGFNISSQDPLAIGGSCLAIQFNVVHVPA